jgi:hypothetical protein
MPDRKKSSEPNDDSWSRFERAVDVVAKSPPQHRKPIKKRRRLARNNSTKNAKRSKSA